MSLWLDGGLLPWGTLATNITGSFIIGLVWGLSAVEEWFQSGGGCCQIAGQIYNFFSIFPKNHTVVGGWQGAAGVELFI